MTTKIEWTNATWNPFVGCSKVSPGCKNCYAIKEAHRLSWNPNEKIKQKYAGTVEFNGSFNWTGKINFDEQALQLPLRWKKPRMIFVNSMSDLFHENVSDEWIDRVFAVMALCPQHIFQILTKRPERMRDYFIKYFTRHKVAAQAAKITGKYDGALGTCDHTICNIEYPLANVWLGCSVENQKTADERVPLLLQTPAAVRWLSCEPLLGELRLDGGMHRRCHPSPHPKALISKHDRKRSLQTGADFYLGERVGVDWVIIGGESGHGARPFNIEWARSLISQCKAANVPVFIKQLGARPFVTGCAVGMYEARLKDRKGGDPSEWPEDLRVREFPER